jgi:hypothetical protein
MHINTLYLYNLVCGRLSRCYVVLILTSLNNQQKERRQHIHDISLKSQKLRLKPIYHGVDLTWNGAYTKSSCFPVVTTGL